MFAAVKAAVLFDVDGGFSSTLSHAGVTYLAASPETMLAPGVPTGVAHDIAHNIDDPSAMAKAVTVTTMDETYGRRDGRLVPAAAFTITAFVSTT